MLRKAATRTIDQLGPGARVALIRIRSLGDSVLTTPAVHLLKRARPDLHIAIVSDPRFAAVWQGNPDIDAILEPDIRALREFRPHLCINLHGGPRSARLTLLSGARLRAGFEHFPYRRLYNIRIPRAQHILGVDRQVHTVEHICSAMFYLGISPTDIPRARLFPGNSLPAIDAEEPFAIIHPAASQPEKTWPAESFLRIAQYLKREAGIQPIFIAGPGDDVSAFHIWPVVNSASLAQVKALIARAAIFIGNDSGPAHLAAAFGIPVVAIFGPSDPVVWAPWKTASQVLVSRGPIDSISVDDVARAVDSLCGNLNLVGSPS